MFNKEYIELSPQETWIRIRFLEIIGSPSLDKCELISLLVIATVMEHLCLVKHMNYIS